MAKPNWKADSLYVYVFKVDRGLSVFIRTPYNWGIIYDIGASDDFSPSEYISKNLVPSLSLIEVSAGQEIKIAQAILSHPHTDHIQDAGALDATNLHPKLLTCPNDKLASEEFDFSTLDQSPELESYRSLFAGKKRGVGLQTLSPKGISPFLDFEYGIYYMKPPEIKKTLATEGQAYINGSSICAYIRYCSNSILLPGDVTPEVMAAILKGDSRTEKRYTSYKDATAWETNDHLNGGKHDLGLTLKKHGLTVLVASHHGLESGYCKEIFDWLMGGKLKLVMTSEKRKIGERDGKTHAEYSSDERVESVVIDIDGKNEQRKSIGTASGKHLLAIFDANGVARYFVRTDIDQLVSIS